MRINEAFDSIVCYRAYYHRHQNKKFLQVPGMKQYLMGDNSPA